MSHSTDVNESASTIGIDRLPIHLFIGLAFVGIWWSIAWFGSGTARELYFFPLWLGFILTIDALCLMKRGTSLLTRSGWTMVSLFVLSIPLWWLFEAINTRLQNWEYVGAEGMSGFSYAWRASVAFSTVIPALFVATELVAGFKRNPLKRLPAWRLGRRGLVIAHTTGWAMLITMLIWPQYLFPFCWLSLFFIIDPLSNLLGGWSVSGAVTRGDWSPIWNAAVAGLICGFFWEMWNIYADPKWIYVVPHVDFGHVFEMPILGYGGYIPFALEVLAFVSLARTILGRSDIPLPLCSSKTSAGAN